MQLLRFKHIIAEMSFLLINPLCFAAPMKLKAHFVMIPHRHLLHLTKSGSLGILLKLPEGIATRPNGEHTTDPHLAMQLLPIGGHKGFGLSMIVDILCALLSLCPRG